MSLKECSQYNFQLYFQMSAYCRISSYIENKVSKSIGLLYKAKLFMKKKSMECLYRLDIHTHLSYTNLAWHSTNETRLTELMIHQKYAFCVINNKSQINHTKELFQSQKKLNSFKINIFNILTFMRKIHCQTAPENF